MEPDEIADVLDRAADALMIYGRTLGTGVRDDGSMCVLGAIAYAQGEDPRMVMGLYPGEARMAFERYLYDLLGPYGDRAFREAHPGLERYPAWVFNDHLRGGPEDDAEVTDALRRCAKSLREEAACS